MSRRVLGNGRVLGGGRVLGAPTASSNLAVASAVKPPLAVPDHVLSPSNSSVSLEDSTAGGSGHSTPPNFDPQDIASRISLDHHGPPSLPLQPTVGDRLACPICNEEMVTLLQLNRHLDDAHKEIQEEQQDEVKDWFKQQVVKAKKFQPLAVLNQKLKGLDVFESNNDLASNPIRSGTPTPRHHSIDAGRAGPASNGRARSASPAPPPPPPPPPPPKPIDPDEVVSKTHWQKRSLTGYDVCSDPTCGRRLGNTSFGIVNCRHCGKLFCEEHTMYQMKLSRSAQHEPSRGLWCRVCETCYKSREGYNDKHGLERSRMDEFSQKRQETVGKHQMEVSRLEKRLSRLTQLLINPPEELPKPDAANRRWSSLIGLGGQNDPRKLLEQTVVAWENDADVARCPYCQQDFSQYTFRRHHCRTCGKVVCGDPNTGCSIMLGLNVAAPNASAPLAEKSPSPSTTPLDVRLCKDCNHTIFSQSDFIASLRNPSTDALDRSYANLLQFERGIRLLLPKFQKLLTALQDPESPPSSQHLGDASRTRKRLLDAFTQYDVAARRIRDLPSTSPTQLKLQNAIYNNASQFLHLHMLPLKALPKVLKHATPTPSHPDSTQSASHGKNALASIRYNHIRQDSSSNISISSATSSRISELESEEKELRERLIVLEEQKFLVQEMVADANKRRKFDEVAALSGSLEELSSEIDGIQRMLDGLDFEGAYAAADANRNGGGLGSGVASPVRQDSGLIARNTTDKENG